MLQIGQTDATVNLGQCLGSSVTDLDSRLHHAGSLSKLLFGLSVDQGNRLVSIDALAQADKVGQTDGVIEFVTGGATTIAGDATVTSFNLGTLTVGGALLLGVTAAYALGRIRFKGKGLLMVTLLGVSMFPQVAVLSGMFELVRFLGLYDSLGALVLSYATFSLPFTIWVLTTFMKNIPVELEEAAIVDGASLWVIITKVFAPIMGPALVTTGLLAFIGAWNEFMFALTFVSDDFNRTVPVGISMISGATAYEIPWGSIMAASVIVTVPLVALVLVFQKKIVSGLTAGAIKG